jgi:hypothetical protein
MKIAGYPKVTDEFKATVMGLLEGHKRATRQPVTRDVVKRAVIRAARLVKAETVEQRRPPPKPAPQPAPARPTQRRTPEGPVRFDDVFAGLTKKYG